MLRTKVTRAREVLVMLVTVGMVVPCACRSDVGPDSDGGARPDPGTGETGGPGVPDAGSVEAGADGEATDADASDAVVEATSSDADAVATLLERSPDCLPCAEAYCSNALEACALGGNVDAGPAMGASKSDLCNETLTCFLSSSCSVYAPFACYCDNYVSFVEPPYCEVDGPCHGAFERSMESTMAPAVARAFTDPSKAGTLAVTLVQCLRDNRCTQCFPSLPEAGADGDDDGVRE